MIMAEDEGTHLGKVVTGVIATETRTTIEGDLRENIEEVDPVLARRLDAHEAQSRELFPDLKHLFLLRTTHIHHQRLCGEGIHQHHRQTRRSPILETLVA